MSIHFIELYVVISIQIFCMLIHFIIQQMYKYIIRLDCAVHTGTTGKYAAITPTTSMSTDAIEPLP